MQLGSVSKSKSTKCSFRFKRFLILVHQIPGIRPDTAGYRKKSDIRLIMQHFRFKQWPESRNILPLEIADNKFSKKKVNFLKIDNTNYFVVLFKSTRSYIYNFRNRFTVDDIFTSNRACLF